MIIFIITSLFNTLYCDPCNPPDSAIDINLAALMAGPEPGMALEGHTIITNGILRIDEQNIYTINLSEYSVILYMSDAITECIIPSLEEEIFVTGVFDEDPFHIDVETAQYVDSNDSLISCK